MNKRTSVPDKQAELIAKRLATKQDLRELELRMVVKLGGLMISCISLLVILMKLFRL
jgi:hypothetical protein